MFVAEIDKPRRLLKITAADQVEPEDVQSCLESLPLLLTAMEPGFRLLTDLSQLRFMSTSCAPDVGKIMELCTEKGLELVIRVLPPEARNDIGFAILSEFHYGPDVRIVICTNLEEAASHLGD